MLRVIHRVRCETLLREDMGFHLVGFKSDGLEDAQVSLTLRLQSERPQRFSLRSMSASIDRPISHGNNRLDRRPGRGGGQSSVGCVNNEWRIAS